MRCWSFQDREQPLRFVLHDRDATFPLAFDTAFAAAGVAVTCLPYRAPNANACAERWVHTVCAECLDHLLIVNETHLRHALMDDAASCNQACPHQGLDQHLPQPPAPRPQTGPGQCRDALGRLLRDYAREAA